MRRRALSVALTFAACLGLSVVVLAPPASAVAATTAPVVPVAQVDLSRYTGTWYQLAAVPAIYELQCARNVTANYSLNPDGTVAVRNTCTTWFDTTSSISGTARSDNAPRNSALTVSFFSLLGKPYYPGTSNYLVFGLDHDYRWALVGSADHQSGFVLSRTPSLGSADVATIRALVKANGYDPCAFRYTPQSGGSSSSAKAC